uniref:HNH endonuclease n=1 Tax=viral metagenome TaxID=1070528 RepID=A0A6H2A3J7_9ZZZZ
MKIFRINDKESLLVHGCDTPIPSDRMRKENKEDVVMGNKIDLPLGQKFGRWTIISEAVKNYRGDSMWNCICDCGRETAVQGRSLQIGSSKSCGCLQKEVASARHFKHGMYGTSTYHIWDAMKSRCLNKNSVHYKNYGGRGIGICDRWVNSFVDFFADMGERPKGLTIERIDNDGDYTPDNCYWANRKEQSRNNRRTRMLKYQGETLCLLDWAKRLGISHGGLRARLAHYSVKVAFTMKKWSKS